ncbi:MAG: OmpA family protein [Bacteroidetes bacterium]|nr:OmpA family protein [Bacteroidota bacterium]
MKVLFRHIFISFILLFYSVLLIAQNGSPALFDKANKLFRNKAYTDAIPQYVNYLQKDSSNSEALINLATCYRLTNDMIQAEGLYKKIVVLNNCPPINYLYLGEALMANGEYDKAKLWLEKYNKNAEADQRGKEHMETIKKLDEYFINSNHFRIKKTNINSPLDEFYPVIYNNGIIFISSRKKISFLKYRNAWTGGNFLSIYYAKNKDSISFTKPKLFAPKLQNKYNNGPLTFNKDFTTLYFNSNNDDNQSKEGSINLGIYESHILPDGKHWDEHVIPFRWNSSTYNCIHPYLSPDGISLFFASDMKLGYGGMDLYVCKSDGNTWGEPENLGPEINTKGNEVFPFLNDKGVLYFTSNGHNGLGGLDLFTSYPIGAHFTEPQNMGSPINSSSDDFGIAFSSTNTGYFSSNREKKGTDDDIYWFTFNTPKKSKIKIKITDSISSSSIVNPVLTIKSIPSQENITPITEKNGFYFADLEIGNNYIIDIKAENYNQKFVSKNITTNTLEIKVVLSRKAEKKAGEYNLKELTDGRPVRIDNMHFEASAWDIPPDANKALNKVVKLMMDNPTLVIELSSHTDCRGDAAANFDLSNKRALSLKEYVVSQGVDSKRVFSTGYGATIPVNKCDCETAAVLPCTEKQYQENNRAEFKVIGYFRNGIISDK